MVSHFMAGEPIRGNETRKKEEEKKKEPSSKAKDIQ